MRQLFYLLMISKCLTGVIEDAALLQVAAARRELVTKATVVKEEMKRFSVQAVPDFLGVHKPPLLAKVLGCTQDYTMVQRFLDGVEDENLRTVLACNFYVRFAEEKRADILLVIGERYHVPPYFEIAGVKKLSIRTSVRPDSTQSVFTAFSPNAAFSCWAAGQDL